MAPRFELLEVDRAPHGRFVDGSVVLNEAARSRAYRVRVRLDVPRRALVLVRAEASWGNDHVERALGEDEDETRRALEREVESSDAVSSALQDALSCCDQCQRSHQILEPYGTRLLCGSCWDEADADHHEPDCLCECCRGARARLGAEADARWALAYREGVAERMSWLGLSEEDL